MKKEFDFIECLSNGKAGENDVIKYLYDKYHNDWKFKYVGDDKEYQKKDIDLLMINDDKEISIEIKTDFTNYDNVFAEYFSSYELKTLGCFVKTEADYIIYYFINKGKMYIIPTLQMKELMYEKDWRIGKALDKVKTKNGYVTKTSMGLLIPIKNILERINLDDSIFNDCEVIL